MVAWPFIKRPFHFEYATTFPCFGHHKNSVDEMWQMWYFISCQVQDTTLTSAQATLAPHLYELNKDVIHAEVKAK
jgi:hypothetical protein